MNQIKLENISMSLDEGETIALNEAKDKSGIKNTSDLVRFLLKAYTSKIFIPPDLRVSEKFKTGQVFKTRGGWEAIWSPIGVYHQINGGVLYTHDQLGRVTSLTVGDDYDLVERISE